MAPGVWSAWKPQPNDEGEVFGAQLPGGTYRVLAAAVGYRVTVQDIELRPGEEHTLELVLISDERAPGRIEHETWVEEFSAFTAEQAGDGSEADG